jgi:monothiol glutaredoxin
MIPLIGNSHPNRKSKMGIRTKIKKRLPIFGRRNSVPSEPAQPQPSPKSSYVPPVVEEPESIRGDEPALEFIGKFVKENPVVIFMKGSPLQPLCGFSANSSAILTSYGTGYVHFDVISDPEVREAVKDFSEWPTLPQIYIGGEFVGGNDILTQMHQSGDLREELEALGNESQES